MSFLFASLLVSIQLHLITQIKSENPEAVMYMADPTQWSGTADEKVEFSKNASTIQNFYS